MQVAGFEGKRGTEALPFAAFALRGRRANMIESPISLTLALALVASALPATAQEMVRSLEPDGPLTRAAFESTKRRKYRAHNRKIRWKQWCSVGTAPPSIGSTTCNHLQPPRNGTLDRT
jgi:hypothetical protein